MPSLEANHDNPVEMLEAEGFSLPAPMRSRLLEKLIASLDTEAEWEATWRALPYFCEEVVPSRGPQSLVAASNRKQSTEQC